MTQHDTALPLTITLIPAYLPRYRSPSRWDVKWEGRQRTDLIVTVTRFRCNLEGPQLNRTNIQFGVYSFIGIVSYPVLCHSGIGCRL